MQEFTARDFGYVEWDDFMRAMGVPQLLRGEIQKHRHKLKHAQNRVEAAEKTLKTESEISFASERLLALIEGWVEEHRAHVGFCERRLKFLVDLSQGRVNEEGPEMVLKDQPPDPEPVVVASMEEALAEHRPGGRLVVIQPPSEEEPTEQGDPTEQGEE